MQNKVMELVKTICSTNSNCRGIKGNELNINILLELKGIDSKSVNVYEVPLNWDNQVVILFTDADQSDKELFAGIGTDGNFYFELDDVIE